jgi:hypothetical protein
MTARSNVSHEQRVAWGRLGGLTGAANHTAEERREFGSIGGRGRAAKYTPEQLRQIYANQIRTRFARMTPEQAGEFQRKAAQGRWRGVTAEEHSRISRKAIERRLGQVAYAKNQEKADRLYAFLREYISAKGYAPSWREIRHATHQDGDTFKRLLQILERIGRIQRHAWNRGITLSPLGAQPLSLEGESTAQGSEAIVVPRQTKKCYQCDDPAVVGKTRCELHLARVREACNRSHAKKRTVGGCVECSALAVEGKTRCERHLALHREASKRNYAKKRAA